MIEKIAITILAITVIYKILLALVNGICDVITIYHNDFRKECHKWYDVLDIINDILLLLSAVSAVYLIISWLVYFLGKG